MVISLSNIRKIGFVSGIVSQVDLLREKYPKLFSEFDNHGEPENEKVVATSDTDNPLASSIDLHLAPFRESKIKLAEYDILKTALIGYFESGTFPILTKPIKIGQVNKKKFGWALNQIYRDATQRPLSYAYLVFAKNNISLFHDEVIDEHQMKSSNLYKYFTTNTR